MKSLKDIVQQLRSCGFTCEAGPLENNGDFRILAKLADVELPKTLSECVDDAKKAFIKLGDAVLEARKYNAQADRDEIIEKAKRDVAKLSEHNDMAGYFSGINLNDLYVVEPEFISNSEKRTVVCLLKGVSSGKVLAKGIAKCAPTDCFNVHIGKAIALRRALGLEVPAEYLNAPQPTDVREGDIVKPKDTARFVGDAYNVCKVEDEKAFDKPGCGWVPVKWVDIVDDSREGVNAIDE